MTSGLSESTCTKLPECLVHLNKHGVAMIPSKANGVVCVLMAAAKATLKDRICQKGRVVDVSVSVKCPLTKCKG